MPCGSGSRPGPGVGSPFAGSGNQLTTAQVGEEMGISRTAAAMLIARSVEALRGRWRRREQKDRAS